MSAPSISITIVTFNSARFIAQCLHYVFEQDYPRFDVTVIDNASSDGTVGLVAKFGSRVNVVRNTKNIGFAEGQNQAIALSNGDWVLTLNPDVRLAADFLSKAAAAGEADPKVGSVSGKLLRMGPDFEIPERRTLDSTGIYFTPSLRHFDRGSGEPDRCQYEQFEYIFGVTGAGALYRREMIADVSVSGEFFDRDFFAYREDADVAWRAQLLGWKCVYAPNAIAYHVRNVLPSNRRSLPAAVNMHSVKNRFLMRINNITGRLYLRHFLAITLRDLLVLGGCVFREFSSVRAFPIVFRSFGNSLRKRKEIMLRRRADGKYIAEWFSYTPVSFPASEVARKADIATVTAL